MKVYKISCVDLICYNCEKFIGQLVKECELDEYEKLAKDAMDHLRAGKWGPLCATCTIIHGEALAATKSYPSH